MSCKDTRRRQGTLYPELLERYRNPKVGNNVAEGTILEKWLALGYYVFCDIIVYEERCPL